MRGGCLDAARARFDNRPVNHRILPFVLCWAAIGLISTWSPSAAPAAPGGAVTVEIVPLAGRAVEGRLTALDGRALSLETAAGTRTFELGAIRQLTRLDDVEPTLAARDHLRVTLTGGEVLLGTYAGATPDGLVLQTPDVGRVSLPLEVVSTVVAVPADAGACFEPERAYPALEDDVLYTRSGDAVAGIVLAVDDGGIEVETAVRGRTRRIAWDELLVLHLQNEPPAPPAGLRIEIETLEGSRLETAGEVTAADESLRCGLRSSPDTRVAVPWQAIRVVRTSGGAFAYASTLPFESELVWYYRDDEREHGYLERWFPARADRRPSGCPLRLAGRTYRHGFAVHSRSVVTVPLDGSWKRFEALFGVDDEALAVPGGGVVDARVLADGKVLWEAKDVRAGEEPRRIGPLDVAGVEALVLEVDFGAALFFGDYATWADPLLFR